MKTIKDLQKGDKVYWIRETNYLTLCTITNIDEIISQFTNEPYEIRIRFKTDDNVMLKYFYDVSTENSSLIEEVMTEDYIHLDGFIYLNKEDVLKELNSELDFINEQIEKLNNE